MRPQFVLSALWFTGALFSFGVLAGSHCPQFYANGEEPAFNVPIQMDQELCFRGFAVGYNYQTRSAIYSAQHITRAAVSAAKQLERVDAFHEESALPDLAQAKLNWYRGSGWSRGHLTANKDQSDRQSQYESFSLANIVPQDERMNTGIWLRIEQATRAMAVKFSDIYVVTGGIYDQSTQTLKGRIPIPNALFKAIYVPSKQLAGVYVADNIANGQYEIISIDEFTRRVGFDVFPAISNDAKLKKEGLYLPLSHKGKFEDRFFR